MRSLLLLVWLTLPLLSGCAMSERERDDYRYYANEIRRNTETSERHYEERDAAYQQLNDTYGWEGLIEVLFAFLEN